MYVDLHMHTTVSDGRLSPTQLVDLTAQKGLHIIAITDHDTTAGLEEAYQAKERYPELTIIPGIELSTDIPGNEVHILGYFLNYDDPKFQDVLKEFRISRLDRGQRMVEKLREMGVYVTWERVLEIAQGGVNSVGRPHIAQAMLEGGYVASMKEAFDNYLGRNAPAYAEREKMVPEDAVALIRGVGGLAVLAHPKDVLPNLDPILDALCGAGLTGMEAYYQGYETELTPRLVDICKNRGLVPCGGSDYHAIETRGEVGPGGVDVPMSTAERLFAIAEANRGQSA